jgi:elongation factor P
MALSVQNLRSGTIFREDGRTYAVVSYHHHKMGRGKAIIRVKVRDIENGGTRELTFNNNSTVDEVDIRRKNLEFVYSDHRKQEVIFSEPESKKRITLSKDIVGDEQTAYLTSGTRVQAMIDEASGDIMAIELPMTVNLKVEETGPSEKGDTAGAARKPAKLETGLIIQVPMFIKNGDMLKVNTQSGEYKERV